MVGPLDEISLLVSVGRFIHGQEWDSEVTYNYCPWPFCHFTVAFPLGSWVSKCSVFLRLGRDVYSVEAGVSCFSYLLCCFETERGNIRGLPEPSVQQFSFLSCQHPLLATLGSAAYGLRQDPPAPCLLDILFRRTWLRQMFSRPKSISRCLRGWGKQAENSLKLKLFGIQLQIVS